MNLCKPHFEQLMHFSHFEHLYAEAVPSSNCRCAPETSVQSSIKSNSNARILGVNNQNYYESFDVAGDSGLLNK